MDTLEAEARKLKVLRFNFILHSHLEVVNENDEQLAEYHAILTQLRDAISTHAATTQEILTLKTNESIFDIRFLPLSCSIILCQQTNSLIIDFISVSCGGGGGESDDGDPRMLINHQESVIHFTSKIWEEINDQKMVLHEFRLDNGLL